MCIKRLESPLQKESASMGRATCRCTLTNGKEVTVINSRPQATTAQLLKAAGIGAGSVSGAIAIATFIYMIVGKIKDTESRMGSQTTKLVRSPPKAKPRIQPRQRR